MSFHPPTATAGFLAVLLGVGAAAGSYGLLTHLSRPAGLTNRLSELEDQAHRVRMAGPAPIRAMYAPGAICIDAPEEAADRLRRRLESAVSQAGLSSPEILVSSAVGPGAGGSLRPVVLQVKATGPYESVVGLLQQLAGGEPEIFIDALDLKSQVSAVSITLAGRVLCSTSGA